MSKNRWLPVLLGLVATTHAFAAEQMKPGNYEYTMKMEMPGMPFAMPAQTFQNCLKQEDVDSGKQFNDKQNKDCEVKNLKQAAGKASFDVACKDGTTGKADYTFSDTQMSGKTVMTREGQAMTMNMAAKRVGDCK
jgi:hypothetical protein